MLTPTRVADDRALSWIFFLLTLLQYALAALDKYELYISDPGVRLPVHPGRVALGGDYKRYLERCAKIQSGLMICVYCLSYWALLELKIPNQGSEEYVNFRLLFFFVLVVVAGDAFSYACEKLIGKHTIVPSINPNKTWEGFLGGVGCATLFGTALDGPCPSISSKRRGCRW